MTETTQELTDDEAAALNAQLGPDDPEPEPEPDDVPEPDHTPEVEPDPDHQPATDAVMEKRYKGAETAFKTYTRKITELWGDDATSLVPFSISPSAPPGFIDPRDAGHVDDVTKAACLNFLGFASEQEYEADPETRTCERCKGKGKTATGSHVTNNESRKCRSCNGYGYTPPPAAGNNGAVGGDDFHFPEGEAPAPLAAPDVDTTGEPRILPDGRVNPNYGKWPQYKVLVPPWGVTAGLTAQDAVA